MAKAVTLKNNDNEDIYPVTSIDLVNGNIPASHFANNAITSDKINWNSVLASADNGKYLLTKTANGVTFEKEPDYRRGDILVVAENTAALSWSGTTKTMWSAGTWTQYGPLKNQSHAHTLEITAPSDADWVIKLHHITGTVQISSAWGHSGLYKSTTLGSMQSYLTSCLVANGDLYLHQETEAIVTIPAGTTMYFGVWVRTSSSTQNQWKGGGDTTATAGDFNFGRSCVIDATLVDIIPV